MADFAVTPVAVLGGTRGGSLSRVAALGAGGNHRRAAEPTVTLVADFAVTPVAVLGGTRGGSLSASMSPCNCNRVHHAVAFESAPAFLAALGGQSQGTPVAVDAAAAAASPVAGLAGCASAFLPPVSLDSISSGWRNAATPVAERASDAAATPMADV